MRRKRTGRKSKEESYREKARRGLSFTGRRSSAIASRVTFALLLLMMIYTGLTSDLTIIAAVAGITVFVWGSILLPVDRFRDVGEYLYSGDAGRDVYEFVCGLVPGFGRGQANVSRTLGTLLLAVLLVASTMTVASVGPAVGQETSTSSTECSTSVYYDEFRTDQALVDEVNASGSASLVKDNTKVRVEESDTFYRVEAQNPNSYCVAYTVDLSSEVLPAADLGTVESTNGTAEARWTDIHDFETQSAYTEVTFVVPANTTILFAPSKPTVFLPAWRDTRKREAESLIETLTGSLSFGESGEDLSERTYRFNGTTDERVTVQLTNPNDTNQQISEWHAVYRTSDEEPWKPVDTETTDPVYYSANTDEDTVSFMFNDEDAVVEFRANPDLSDEVLNQVRSYRRSLFDIRSLWPLTIGSVVSL